MIKFSIKTSLSLIVFACIILFSNCREDETVTLIIKVKDQATLEAVSLANVTVGKDTNLQKKGITNSSGKYKTTFDVIAVLEIEVEKDGKVGIGKVQMITQGETYEKIIYLN